MITVKNSEVSKPPILADMSVLTNFFDLKGSDVFAFKLFVLLLLDYSRRILPWLLLLSPGIKSYCGFSCCSLFPLRAV